MEPMNLYALAEDRRIAREREARVERLRRRPKAPVGAVAKCGCTGTVPHPAPRPTSP